MLVSFDSRARGAETTTYFARPKKARKTVYQQTMGMWISGGLIRGSRSEFKQQ
jgi:hypothetical protein